MHRRLKRRRRFRPPRNNQKTLQRRNAAGKNSAFIAGRILPLVAALFFGSPALFADDLQTARNLAQTGHAEEAVALYQKWLQTSPASATWDHTLLRTASLMTDPTEAVATLLDGLPKLSTESARHEVYVRVGRLDELLGDWTGAQESFQNASLVPGPKDFVSLLQSARILIQLGELPKASAQARSVVAICQDPAIVAAAQVLLVRLDAIAGRVPDAQTRMARLLDGPTELSARSLAELYDAAGTLGLAAQQSRIRSTLRARFPQSPESAVIEGKTAAFPSPATLLGFAQSPYGDASAPPAGATALGTTNSEQPAPVQESASSAAGQKQSIDIQIGSYRDQTNAEYRLQDLKNAGFAGRILKADIGGTTYYKVVIPGVPIGMSQDMLTKLKVKGFEGFLLYD